MSSLRPVNSSGPPPGPPTRPLAEPGGPVDRVQLLTGEGPLTVPPRWTSSAGFVPGAAPGPEGTVLAGSPGGELVALRVADGSEQWRAAVGELAGSPVPGVAGDTVACTRDGRVVCVGPDGAPRWERRLADSLSEAPLSAPGDHLLVRTPDGSLAKLRASDGAQVWSQKVGGGFERAPRPAVDADGHVYVLTFRPTHLHSLDSETGLPRWSVGVNETPNSLATGQDGRVYVGYTVGRVSAYETAGGGFLWHGEAGGRDSHAPVRVAARDGSVFAATDSGHLFALEGESGRNRWSRELGGRLSTPVGTPEGMLVSDPAGRVRQVDGGSGAVRWQSPGLAEAPPGARPAEPCAAGSAVVASDAAGRLQALDLRATLEDLAQAPAPPAGPEIRHDADAITIGGISLPIRQD